MTKKPKTVNKIKSKISKKTIIIAIIILTLLVAIGAYFIFFKKTPAQTGGGGSGSSGETQERIIITEVTPGLISQMLSNLGAKELHNPPLSKDAPKIKVIVDDTTYFAEIIKGKIITQEEDLGEADLIIRTTKQEILDAVNSGSFKSAIGVSFNSGKTTYEVKIGYVKLLAKGYATVYKELTGKTLKDLIKDLI